LRNSILRSLTGYLALQAALWFGIAVVGAGVSAGISVGFIVVSVLLHAGMTGFLLWRMADFRNVDSGVERRRVHLAAHLTIFRLSSAPTMIFLALPARESTPAGVALIVLAGIVFLTDLFDGRIARRLDQVTRIGTYMDSSTDYVILMSLVLVFVVLGITPIWYVVVLGVRLVGFALVMGLLSLRDRRVTPDTTLLGKAAVFSAMVTIAFELARFAEVPGVGHPDLVLGIEIASAAVILISMADKILYVLGRLRLPGRGSD
jgi:phosphatidylglycerophosphate synthase